MNTVNQDAGARKPAPDVLVVVMDCVRASDFPGGSDPVRMPFVERLRSECISFPRAASVAPWTLPSHASLFTGLYPWEHGCHGRGGLRLDRRFERLPQQLRSQGYRTLSLSANPMISPYYGLVDGFDIAEWGGWWEQVYRTKASPPRAYEAPAAGRPAPDPPVRSRRSHAARAFKTMLTRVPAVLALGDSVVRHTVDPYGRGVGNMNPWIEPELGRWLARQPSERPTFCFINLLDAHEPYILDPSGSDSLMEWWRFMRIPQDVLALLVTPTPPPAEDLHRLHELYRRAIAALDRRLGRIVEIYRRAGRWENTLLLLTSDHGQAFGEHGMVWHGVRTDEEMLRVPLMLRLPRGELGGATGRGWASPIDAMPTVLEAAGVSPSVPPSGVPLQRLVTESRAAPLLSAGDGTEWNRPFWYALSPQRRTELNLFSIAAYIGPVKVVVNALTGEVRGYDLSSDAPAELPPHRLNETNIQAVVQQARQAIPPLLHATSIGVSTETDQRLRSWGYG